MRLCGRPPAAGVLQGTPHRDAPPSCARVGLLHPDVPVVRLLQRQAAEASDTMLDQLLQRLCGSIQVPTQPRPRRGPGQGRPARIARRR